MAQTVCVIISAEDRARLAAIIGDRSRPLKHMQRARIVLQSADRLPAMEISRRAGVSRPAVWRWQRHYAEEGVERLLREGSRKPGKAPVAVATVAKVLALTNADPPDETTHWTGRAMAKAVNLSLRTVQRIWGGPQATTPPLAHLQALQGARFRRESRGHRRPLHASPR